MRSFLFAKLNIIVFFELFYIDGSLKCFDLLELCKDDDEIKPLDEFLKNSSLKLDSSETKLELLLVSKSLSLSP